MQCHPTDQTAEHGQAASAGPTCPFCVEIQDPLDWPHSTAYNHQTRITAPTDALRILPTLGQLVPGSLLLLPAKHVERFADLSPSQRSDALETARAIVARFETEENGWVMFEHGALAPGGGGCGLYHGHLHLVPVAVPPTAAELLPTGQDIYGLDAGWDSVDTADDYLICASSDGSARFRTVVPEERTDYPSQYFRRQLHHHLGLEGPWDWREFDQPERAIEQWIERALEHAGT